MKIIIYIFFIFTLVSCSSTNNEFEELQERLGTLDNQNYQLRSENKRLKENLVAKTVFLSLPDDKQKLLSISWLNGFFHSVGDKFKQTAQKDIKKNNINILGFGVHKSWLSDFQKELKEKYNVNYIDLGSCEYPNELNKFIEDYNSITEKFIEQKFGQGILEKVYESALGK